MGCERSQCGSTLYPSKPHETLEGLMRLPIDTNGITFLCAMAPEPVMDFDTKRQKGDANGEPLYAVQLVLLADGGAEVISVKVPGSQPAGLTAGVPVTVAGLVATPWSMGDRSGVSFKATSISTISTGDGGRGVTPTTKAA
jgi:hypothetical protein